MAKLSPCSRRMGCRIGRRAGWLWRGARAALPALHDLRSCPSNASPKRIRESAAYIDAGPGSRAWLKRYSQVNDPLVLLKALDDCYLGMWGHQHNDNRTDEERRSPRFLHYYNADDILLLFDEKNSI